MLDSSIFYNLLLNIRWAPGPSIYNEQEDESQRYLRGRPRKGVKLQLNGQVTAWPADKQSWIYFRVEDDVKDLSRRRPWRATPSQRRQYRTKETDCLVQ